MVSRNIESCLSIDKSDGESLDEDDLFEGKFYKVKVKIFTKLIIFWHIYSTNRFIILYK